MSMQTMSLLFSLAGILILLLVLLRIRLYGGPAQPYAPVQGRAYRIRAVLFWVLVIIGIPFSLWLLRMMPYAAAPAGAQVVNVTASQFSWDFDRDEVLVGQPVQFNVSSVDVNHGFGLYDEDERIVAQVQAMPGYINQLTHTFDVPGTYAVRCLEYCGNGHHYMESELTVSTTLSTTDDDETDATDGAGDDDAGNADESDGGDNG